MATTVSEYMKISGSRLLLSNDAWLVRMDDGSWKVLSRDSNSKVTCLRDEKEERDIMKWIMEENGRFY